MKSYSNLIGKTYRCSMLYKMILSVLLCFSMQSNLFALYVPNQILLNLDGSTFNGSTFPGRDIIRQVRTRTANFTTLHPQEAAHLYNLKTEFYDKFVDRFEAQAYTSSVGIFKQQISEGAKGSGVYLATIPIIKKDIGIKYVHVVLSTRKVLSTIDDKPHIRFGGHYGNDVNHQKIVVKHTGQGNSSFIIADVPIVHHNLQIDLGLMCIEDDEPMPDFIKPARLTNFFEPNVSNSGVLIPSAHMLGKFENAGGFFMGGGHSNYALGKIKNWNDAHGTTRISNVEFPIVASNEAAIYSPNPLTYGPMDLYGSTIINNLLATTVSHSSREQELLTLLSLGANSILVTRFKDTMKTQFQDYRQYKYYINDSRSTINRLQYPSEVPKMDFPESADNLLGNSPDHRNFYSTATIGASGSCLYGVSEHSGAIPTTINNLAYPTCTAILASATAIRDDVSYNAHIVITSEITTAIQTEVADKCIVGDQNNDGSALSSFRKVIKVQDHIPLNRSPSNKKVFGVAARSSSAEQLYTASTLNRSSSLHLTSNRHMILEQASLQDVFEQQCTTVSSCILNNRLNFTLVVDDANTPAQHVIKDGDHVRVKVFQDGFEPKYLTKDGESNTNAYNLVETPTPVYRKVNMIETDYSGGILFSYWNVYDQETNNRIGFVLQDVYSKRYLSTVQTNDSTQRWVLREIDPDYSDETIREILSKSIWANDPIGDPNYSNAAISFILF